MPCNSNNSSCTSYNCRCCCENVVCKTCITKHSKSITIGIGVAKFFYTLYIIAHAEIDCRGTQGSFFEKLPQYLDIVWSEMYLKPWLQIYLALSVTATIVSVAGHISENLCCMKVGLVLRVLMWLISTFFTVFFIFGGYGLKKFFCEETKLEWNTIGYFFSSTAFLFFAFNDYFNKRMNRQL